MVSEAGIAQAVSRLDAWLDTMRGPGGYGGPVAHWWQDCLLYTGAGLDWRYEGIIIGYLNLYERTGDERWLAKARRAGDDLVGGQLPTGNFRNSSFELNPCSGGTPHEAACDLALLHLAGTLKRMGDDGWERYVLVAERNLRGYHLGRLWSDQIPGFCNSADNSAFTPNKSATTVEALLALAELQGDQELVERYALPTLGTILGHQVAAPGRHLDGAIDQNSLAGKRGHRYFPFYNARCIPALLKGYEFTGDERFCEAARRAMAFIQRTRLPDGSFPQVIYGNGQVNRYPQWVAGVGDILRAMALLEPYGVASDPVPTLAWLLGGQGATGGFRTASGFAAQVSQREPGPLPDLRDLLPACGWVDKAFRYLSEAEALSGTIEAEISLPDAATGDAALVCTFWGRSAKYREDETAVEVTVNSRLAYRYRKGATWAEMDRGG